MTRINGRALVRAEAARPLSAAVRLRTVNEPHITPSLHTVGSALSAAYSPVPLCSRACEMHLERTCTPMRVHADQPRWPLRRGASRRATMPDANAHGGRHLLEPGYCECPAARSTTLK